MSFHVDLVPEDFSVLDMFRLSPREERGCQGMRGRKTAGGWELHTHLNTKIVFNISLVRWKIWPWGGGIQTHNNRQLAYHQQTHSVLPPCRGLGVTNGKLILYKGVPVVKGRLSSLIIRYLRHQGWQGLYKVSNLLHLTTCPRNGFNTCY